MTSAELKNVQENLRDLLQLNNTVFEKMENGFIISEENGRVISFNSKANQMIKKLMIDSNIFELLFNQNEIHKINQLSSEVSKYYLEKPVSQYYFGISISIIERIYSYNKVIVFIITDLTEKKVIENKLKEKEHLVILGEVASSIAHELRNPLASISGSIQFLSKELKLSSEYKNLMNIVVQESNRLSKSIEDFLNFSRITPLQIIDFDLSLVMDDIVGLLSRSNSAVGFLKKYNQNNIIQADQERIKQVIWNLLSNAIKAVQGRGEITISIFIEKNKTCLSIKDNGMGMGKQDIAKIFQPFFSRFTTGIGLGMAIVKRIIDEHGFAIKVKSEKKIGTEVIICF